MQGYSEVLDSMTAGCYEVLRDRMEYSVLSTGAQQHWLAAVTYILIRLVCCSPHAAASCMHGNLWTSVTCARIHLQTLRVCAMLRNPCAGTGIHWQRAGQAPGAGMREQPQRRCRDRCRRQRRRVQRGRCSAAERAGSTRRQAGCGGRPGNAHGYCASVGKSSCAYTAPTTLLARPQR